MESVKITKTDLDTSKLNRAQEYIEKAQDIVAGSSIENVPNNPDAESNKENAPEKSSVQMIFNYILTFLIFGWLFFLIAIVLAFPGTRIIYEMATTKYSLFRTFLIFATYSFFLSSNPYVLFIQMVYTMTIFMFYESLDWWGLFTLSPGKMGSVTTPLFWDEGLQSILTNNGLHMGVKNTFEQVSNIDFTFEELRKLMEEVDIITNTVTSIKNSTLETLKAGEIPDSSNFFAKSSYINIAENTPETITGNLNKVNNFTFTRGDALDSVLSSNAFIMKYGETGDALKEALHDPNATKITYTPPTIQNPNARTITLSVKEPLTAGKNVLENREKVLGVFDSMGIRNQTTNVTMYFFLAIAFLILMVAYYYLSYDKPMFRMVKISEMGMDLKEEESTENNQE